MCYVRVWFLIICISINSLNVCDSIYLTPAKDIEFLYKIETKNSYISYIKIKGKKFIVKQKKEEKKQISVVKDALAAYIAKILHIAHEVSIVPLNIYIPGKVVRSWPATIHTIALGDTIRKQKNSIYSSLQLKQQWALAKTFAETGLTREIITQMTWHPQLALIVALDIIIGNYDRHAGNLCYDSVTDTFCAIDMDDTFNKDLCEVAHKKLEMMIQDSSISFTIEEVNALIQLRKTLCLLAKKYTSEHIIKKLHSYAVQAGFVSGNRLYTPSVKKKLNHYSSMIAKSWKNVRKVIGSLNKIINSGLKKNYDIKGAYYEPV